MLIKLTEDDLPVFVNTKNICYIRNSKVSHGSIIVFTSQNTCEVAEDPQTVAKKCFMAEHGGIPE